MRKWLGRPKFGTTADGIHTLFSKSQRKNGQNRLILTVFGAP